MAIVLLFSDHAHFDISAQPNKHEPAKPIVWTKPPGMVNKKGKWTS
jgi:hypothetical protein